MAALTGPVEPVPVAVLARTSALVLQDPAASLRRQITSTREWRPPGFYVAGYYWDVESGALDLEQRGRRSYEQFTGQGIPRDGAWPTCWPKPGPRVPVLCRGGRRHRARLPRFLQFGAAGTGIVRPGDSPFRDR